MKLKLVTSITALTLMFFVSAQKASATMECEGSPVEGTIEKIQQTYAKWNLCLGHYAVSSEEGSDKFYRVVYANFKNGVKHGLGKILYSSGDKYVGDFFEDKQTGSGTLTFFSGDKYVGDFKDGKYNGTGALTFFSGDKYVGDFKDNLFHGDGVATKANGNVYSGELRYGKYNGKGTFEFASGHHYAGEFQKNLRHGHGVFTWSNGDKYVGDFKDDKYDGTGALTFVSGDKYLGDFKEGKYHGSGTLTLEKGTTYMGVWASGTLVKSEKGLVSETFDNLTEKIPLPLLSFLCLIFSAILSVIFFETPRSIFLEEVQTFNKERSLTRIKTSVIVTSGLLCVPFGIWMLSEELLFGGSMIITICPCLLIYPMIRGLFFGGKDSFAAAATTVIVEEVTKAGISSAVRKMEEKKKRKR